MNSRVQYLFSHLPESGTVLDIGNLADDGMIHKEISKRYPGVTVYGLDIDDQKEHGLSFDHQYTGSVEALPFEDQKFNAIYMGQVFEHTWIPLVVLQECYRVLIPGGVIIFDTPNVYALSRMLRYAVTGKDVILGNPDHKIFFSRAMVENALEKVGFTDIETTSDKKCTIKGRHFSLPTFAGFTYMGEHLIAKAKRPS